MLYLRERAVPLAGTVGASIAIDVTVSGFDWAGASVEALVYGSDGETLATFSEQISGDTLTLSLSQVSTTNLGPGTRVWALKVGSVFWIGGRFRLDLPGVGLEAEPSYSNVRVSFSPYVIELSVPGASSGSAGLTAEDVVDAVAGALREGTNMDVAYDDAAGTITLTSTASGGGGLTEEQVVDLVAAALREGNNMDVAYDDAAGTITLSSSAAAAGVDVATISGTTYTPVIGDANDLKIFTSDSPVTVTLPTNGSVPFVEGTSIDGAQSGAGLITIVGASGVTIVGATYGKVTLGRGASFHARKLSANEWTVGGDVQAAPETSVEEPPPAAIDPGYIRFPGTVGNQATIADAADLDGAGDKTFIWTMAVPDTTPAALGAIASKYNTTGNQRSWLIQVGTTGAIRWQWSEDGTSFSSPTGGLIDFSAATLPIIGLTVNEFESFKLEFDVINGLGGHTARLYTLGSDGTTWNLMQEVVDTTNPTSIFVGTAALILAAISAGTATPGALDLRDFEMLDGIGPSAISRFKFVSSDIPADNNTNGQTMTSTSGHTMTIGRTTDPNTLLVPDDTEEPAPTYQFPMGGIATGFVLSNPLSTDLALIQGIVPGGFVRTDFSWKTAQPTNTTPNWSTYDARITAQNSYGLKTLAMLGYTPSWANGGFSDDKYPPAAGAGVTAWQAYCNAFALRYLAAPYNVRVFELWNEPNLQIFWKPTPNVANYVSRVLIPGYNGIVAAAATLGIPLSEIAILTAGTAPRTNDGTNIDPRTFCQGILDNGGTNYFTDYAVHPYTWPYPPTQDDHIDPASFSPNQWNAMQQVRDIRRRLLLAGKDCKIWATEVGLPSADNPGTYPTSGYVSHQLMVTRINEIFAEWHNGLHTQADPGWIGPLIWYQHRNSTVAGTEGAFGVTYNSGADKPGNPSPRQALTAAFAQYPNTI